ncbi:hypothetical protein ABPG74_016847 [Tetrahymena malaccensis]
MLNSIKIAKIIFLLSLVQVLGISSKRELQMVQVLFRHGARYTMHGNILKDDPEREMLIDNRGQLTEVGMRQLYLLGKKIRRNYITDQNFIDQQYNKQQIHVQSSNVNRTLQSAQSFMLGLYPIGTGFQIPTGVKSELLSPPSFTNSDSDKELLNENFANNQALPSGFYPYPIHSLGNHDHILNPPCPAEDEIVEKQYKKAEKQIQEEINKYTQEIHTITKKLGIKGNYVAKNITKIQDIINTQKYRGIDYGITEEEYQLVMYLKAYVKILQQFTFDYSRLISSPLFNYIFSHFDNKINDKTSLKMIIESTHDSQIMPMLVMLQLINADCLKADYDNETNNCQKFPPFASNFIFELYSVAKDEFEIQIKYNGNYIKVCGDKIFCSYKEFKNQILKKLVSMEDYPNQCGLTAESNFGKSDKKSYIPVWIIVLIVILVLVIIGLVIYIKKIQNDYNIHYERFKNVVSL